MNEFLLEKDKTLIEHHCKVNFDHTYMIYGIKFQCDMGEDYTLIMFNNCQLTIGPYHKEKFGYILKHNGRIIFHGYDLGLTSMPSNAIVFFEAIEATLSFLTLKHGDTDNDYFSDYTARQLEWSHKHAENLDSTSMRIYEHLFEDGPDKNNPNDQGYTVEIKQFFYVEQGYAIAHFSNLSLPVLIEKLQSIIDDSMS